MTSKAVLRRVAAVTAVKAKLWTRLARVIMKYQRHWSKFLIRSLMPRKSKWMQVFSPKIEVLISVHPMWKMKRCARQIKSLNPWMSSARCRFKPRQSDLCLARSSTRSSVWLIGRRTLAKLGAWWRRSRWQMSSRMTWKRSNLGIKFSLSASTRTTILTTCPSTSRSVLWSIAMALETFVTVSRKRTKRGRLPNSSWWTMMQTNSPSVSTRN